MSLDLSRRRFLIGAIAAPVVIRTAGLLMPVKALPDQIVSRGVARIVDVVSEGEIAGLINLDHIQQFGLYLMASGMAELAGGPTHA